MSPPGFWVGLLITVVLGGLAVFFLGPWALLLLPFIGALAAAGAQLTNNLWRGEADPWKGVWDAAVEGFVVGAVFAAAIGIGLWAGLGAMGILIVVKIVTVVVTIVSNVIHGERPTKNLLANMLFAWLLDRIFRHVPTRGGGAASVDASPHVRQGLGRSREASAGAATVSAGAATGGATRPVDCAGARCHRARAGSQDAYRR